METAAYQQMRELQSTHWWFVARRQVLASLIDRLGLPSNAAILEAGCGPCGNFELLCRYGKLSAFDMDPATVADNNRLAAVECVQGRLPADHPFHESHRFDLVAALDVIEHVEADVESLRSLASCLCPEGRVLVTVPAYQWLFSAHDRFHHHHRRYRLRSLTVTAKAAGLQVERAGYFNSILFPGIALARLAGRLRGADARSDMKMPSPAVNWLLTRVFSCEARLLPHMRFPFGTSIYLVGKV